MREIPRECHPKVEKRAGRALSLVIRGTDFVENDVPIVSGRVGRVAVDKRNSGGR